MVIVPRLFGDWVESSAVAGIFSWKSLGYIYIVRISGLHWTEFHQNLYMIIPNKLWDLSLYFGDLYNRWVLARQQKGLGPSKCARFEQCKHIQITVLVICWRLSAFKSPSHKKSIFLKIRSFFSFKFFQGHCWLTNYPDSEFHDHWKTVTLSSISPNSSKYWRFLVFWLSLCFGSFLLFLVCHDTTFLFSRRAMTALGWLPNAHRDMIILYEKIEGIPVT